MKQARAQGVWVGILFLIATASYFAGSTHLSAAIDALGVAPARAALARTQLAAGALLVLVDAIAVVGIGALVFPLLRSRTEAIAAGYLALRVLEAAVLVAGLIAPLSVLPATGESDVAPWLLALARQSTYWSYQLAMVALGPAGLAFSVALLAWRLVPKAIAVLGVIGYPLLIAGAVLDMLGWVDTLHGGGMLLLAPGGVFEFVLPIWLILKGFAPPSVTRETALEYSSDDRYGAATGGSLETSFPPALTTPVQGFSTPLPR